MNKDETWIKLYRSMLNWEWYNDKNVKVLFLHLLLSVNIEPQRKRGIVVPAGAIDRTIEQLAAETGLSMRQTRTAIEKLKMTGELSIERHSYFSVFTVVNWYFFQGKRQKNVTSDDKMMTEERQKNDNLNKNIKNNKEWKENIYADAEENSDDFFESWIIDENGQRQIIDMKEIITDTEITYMDRAGNFYINDYEKGYVLKNE